MAMSIKDTYINQSYGNGLKGNSKENNPPLQPPVPNTLKPPLLPVVCEDLELQSTPPPQLPLPSIPMDMELQNGSSLSSAPNPEEDDLNIEETDNEDIAWNRWYFTEDELMNSPSRRDGITADDELTKRQKSANFIQELGQRLKVNQLCISTAIVYMHRFFMVHSFNKFEKESVSLAALFLASKVEEIQRSSEHIVRIGYAYRYQDIKPQLVVPSETYDTELNELLMHENILIQTLGFDFTVEHPHTAVALCCKMVQADKDLAQSSYFMATTMLQLSTMCLQHRPTVMACVCIYVSCKWSSYKIPLSKEGKEWFSYVDSSITLEQLELLTTEFLSILKKSPFGLKQKSMTSSGGSPNFEGELV